MAIGDLSFAFDAAKGETPQTIARKRQLAEAILGESTRAPKDIGEGLNAIGQALLYRKLLSGTDKAETAGTSGAAKVFGSLFGNQFPAAPGAASAADLPTQRVAQAAGDEPGPSNDYFSAIRTAESGGSDAAKNPLSSATGRYQFTTGTWGDVAQAHPELGLTPDGRLDPAQQEKAIRAFTADNANVLSGAGIPTTGGNLYAAHFLGAGGAKNVLTQPDGASVAALVGPEVVKANPFLAGMSVGQFKQWAARHGGGNAPVDLGGVQVASLDPSIGMPPSPVPAADAGTARPLPAEFASKGITQAQWDAMNAPGEDLAPQPPVSPNAAASLGVPFAGQPMTEAQRSERQAQMAPLLAQVGQPYSPAPLPLGFADPQQPTDARQAITAAMLGGNQSAPQGRPPASPVGPFPGLMEQGNIDLANRPVVRNPDGSYSTVRSMSFEDNSGREILVPTVSPDGKILSNRDAMELYGKTGQNLGKFDTPKDADMYAEALHKAQERFYGNPAQQGEPTTSQTEVGAPGGPASVTPAGQRVLAAMMQQQPMMGGAAMPMQAPLGASPVAPEAAPAQMPPTNPDASGKPQGAGAPGEIRRGSDGKNYQYAETTGMAGATGPQGWIETSMAAPASGAPTPEQGSDLSQLPAMAGGNADVLPPGAAQEGPSIEQLMQAASNPWVMKQYGPVVNALLEQKMKASDPATKLAMEKARLDMEKTRIETEQLRNPQMSPAEKARLDFDKEKFAADQKKLMELSPGTTVFDPAARQPVYSAPEKSDVLSPEALAQKLQLSKAGASNVNVDTKGETKYDQTLGEELAKKTVGIMDAGQQAPNKIATYQQMMDVLPGIYTGTGGDSLLTAKRALKGLGVDTGDLSGQEFVQAMGNQMALELRNPAGGAGMPGAMSDADRAFLSSMSPSLSKTPEGNKKLLEYRMTLEKRNVDVAQRANEYMNTHGGRLDNNFFSDLSKWSAANPLFPETTKATSTKGPKVMDGYTIEEEIP